MQNDPTIAPPSLLANANPKDWKYAGQPLSAVQNYCVTKTESGKHVAEVVTDTNHRQKYAIEEVFSLFAPAEDHYRIRYLIPIYEETEPEYRRREQRLLIKSKDRLLNATNNRDDTPRKKEELEEELAAFAAEYERLNGIRTGNGQPPLTFLEERASLSDDEIRLRIQGERVAGHAINRLVALGEVILQEGRQGVNIEYNSEHIRTNIESIKSEFQALYINLAFENLHLFSCLRTRFGEKDYDGTFVDMVRDLGKALHGVLENSAIADNATPAEEKLERSGILNKIASTLGAIDETYGDLARLVEVKDFRDSQNEVMAKNRTETQRRMLARESQQPNESTERSISSYQGLLKEYAALCRARACIRVQDTANINPISERLRFVYERLQDFNQQLEGASQFGASGLNHQRQMPLKTIALLKKGINLMFDMAELRMPRNYAASTDLKSVAIAATKSDDSAEKRNAFRESDNSSAGRLRREIGDHMIDLDVERSDFERALGVS
jgi:hypothetical protein